MRGQPRIFCTALLMLLGGAVAASAIDGEIPTKPPIKASALYMIELPSGRVLMEKNADRRLPPASLTKVMTVLVALESAPLQQIVHIEPRALNRRTPTLELRPGEQFLLRDLLAAMLITSANDACQAVALHIGGEAATFVAMMNDRARAWGLANTHFVNACGFDAPDHYSTAADLATLTMRALQMPAFAMMVRTVTREISTVDGARSVTLYSTNQLMLDPDITGVKTGYTSKAGRCLIASMIKDGRHLLLVGLNLMDRWEQAASLLRYGHALLQTESQRSTIDR